MKTEQPSPLCVHCLAHSLNLCLQDVARHCIDFKDALDLVRDSPKRSALFERLKEQLSPQT